MKASELRNKSVTELQSELEGLLREGFNLRMQHGSGQMTQGHRLRQNRRDIARVKTILGEKAGN